MINEPCRFYAFLHAVGGNWRNAIFIECKCCPHGKAELCSGFLLTPDSDGRPLLLTAEAVQAASGQEIDRMECLAVMRREQFEALFSLWLTWRTESSKDCALLAAAGQFHCGNTR